MRFHNRRSAGQELAARLQAQGLPRTSHVVALARGGVEVAVPIALALRAPLEVSVTRKIGFPGHREFAIGALTAGGTVVLDESLIHRFQIDRQYLTLEFERLLAQAKKMQEAYKSPSSAGAEGWKGKTLILVDDGAATGWTALAAAREIRRSEPARLVVALPAASPEAVDRLRAEADDVVVLELDEDFRAVGEYYDDFQQLTDADVTSLLAEANVRDGALSPPAAGGSLEPIRDGGGAPSHAGKRAPATNSGGVASRHER